MLIILAVFRPVCAEAPAETGAGVEAAGFESALREAITDPAIPFGFSVHCVDEKGNRSARLYPGGVAVWGGRLQISTGGELRLKLLDDILSSGFSSFAPQYGGTGEDGRSEGPLRVSCRVEVTVADTGKQSVQALGGEQSKNLATLAAGLLDRLEPLASGGMGADSLEDGLRKISAGTLAPEMLSIRLVQLPDKNVEAKGHIVRVDAARWSWQDYRPGEAGPASDWEPLPEGFTTAFAEAALTAQFWSIPVNVPGNGHNEIEVQVLDHHKTVISRSFTQIEPGAMAADKERFDAVAAAVLRVRQ